MFSKKIFKILLGVLSILSIAVLLIQQNPPSNHYILSFLYLSIPFTWVFNSIAIVVYGSMRSRLVLIPILFMVISLPQARETFAINLNKLSPQDSALKVVSYNVGAFNYLRFHSIMDTVASKESIDWLANNIQADIICLQEFYNDDAGSAEQSLEKLDSTGVDYFYTNPIKIGNHNGYFGLITFSRYPIINGGALIFGDTGLNRGVFTDIKVNDDTLRVINIHMKSMTIRIDSSTSLSEPTTILANALKIKDKLKMGFDNRNQEIEVIADFIDNSPYKVILCGDFNETPYSYVYRHLRNRLHNAFEEAGNGFGFTYNRFPYFIRIDNQFYDKKLKAVYFTVHDNENHSDHLPVEVHYKLD